MVEKPEMAQAQHVASSADEIFGAIFAAAPDGIVVCDDEGRCLFANAAACDLFGVDSDKLAGKHVGAFVGFDEDRGAWQHFRDSGNYRAEFALARPDGSRASLEARGLARCVPGRYVFFLRDMSSRASFVADAVDAERLRIAHDLHDAVGQTLSLLKMSLQRTECDTKGDKRRLSEPLALIDDLIRQVRTMIFDLHPTMLTDLGLVPTLQHYVGELAERTGLEITMAEVGQRRPLGTPALNGLFRAAKELLANAAKHASAAAIVLTVQWEPERLRLIVDDDGVGMKASSLASPRPIQTLGLASVRERAEALGGHLRIESQKGHGTRVAIDVALPKGADGNGS
jgi:PAS domain S-box-containing protein